jgi:hypothetical protein
MILLFPLKYLKMFLYPFYSPIGIDLYKNGKFKFLLEFAGKYDEENGRLKNVSSMEFHNKMNWKKFKATTRM